MYKRKETKNVMRAKTVLQCRERKVGKGNVKDKRQNLAKVQTTSKNMQEGVVEKQANSKFRKCKNSH